MGIGRYDAQFQFDPLCMRNLKEIIEKTGADIVISSDWRLGDKKHSVYWHKLKHNLAQYGLEDKIIGCTPDLSDIHGSWECRGHEIQKWIDDNSAFNIKNFTILDDKTDMFHLMPKLVQCHCRYGLNREAKEKALHMLAK